MQEKLQVFSREGVGRVVRPAWLQSSPAVASGALSDRPSRAPPTIDPAMGDGLDVEREAAEMASG